MPTCLQTVANDQRADVKLEKERHKPEMGNLGFQSKSWGQHILKGVTFTLKANGLYLLHLSPLLANFAVAMFPLHQPASDQSNPNWVSETAPHASLQPMSLSHCHQTFTSWWRNAHFYPLTGGLWV